MDAIDPSPATVRSGSRPGRARSPILISVAISTAVLGIVVAGLVLARQTLLGPEPVQFPAIGPITSGDDGGDPEEGDAGHDQHPVAALPSPTEAGNPGYAPTDPAAPAPPDADQAPPPPEEVPTVPGGIIRRDKVAKDTPVIKSLTRLGLTMADANSLILALQGTYDFRRAQPGHEMLVEIDPNTRKPVRFVYRTSMVDVYQVRRDAQGQLKGRKLVIPTQKKLVLFGGTISSSLYKAIENLGINPVLTGRMVEVLSSDPDFFKAQRPGDTFRAMVEEESIDGHFLSYGPILALEYTGEKSGEIRLFRYSEGDDRATYFNEKGISVPRSVISIPLHYTRISSPFGTRYHPILKIRKMHNGVDFAAGSGAPVWACQAGKVIIADRRGANGNLVAIQHAEGAQSYYAHLARFAPGIRNGVEVKERQVIGYVGSTGRSTGPHLHFGFKAGGRFVDPLKYKIRPGRAVAARYRSELLEVIAERGRALDHTPIRAPSGPVEKDTTPEHEVLGVEDDDL